MSAHCRTLRIAFFLHQFPVVSETFILDQITGLLDRGHEVDIYAREAGAVATLGEDLQPYRLLDRTRYHAPPASRWRRAAAAGRLLATRFRRRPAAAVAALNPLRYGVEAVSLSRLFLHGTFVDRRPYDVVHCHFGPIGRLVDQLRGQRLIRGALITTFHGFDATRALDEHGGAYYRSLFARGDLFLPVSEYLKRRLVAAGCPADKTIVHHMGLDCAKFRFRPPGPHTGSAPRLLTVGRLVEKKGIRYGIRAVAALAGDFPQIRYRVIGDGPLRPELETLVRQLGAGAVVELLGWRSHAEVREELVGSDLLLAPSVTAEDGDEEGIPVVLMEAMAIGLPVVSTFHSGIPELVAEDRSGVLVPPRDALALAAALRQLLRQPDRWAEMARQGRQTVEQQFDRRRLNDRLVQLYARAARPDDS